MNNDIEKLENEIKALYPEITDIEAKTAKNTLIDFFAIGVKVLQEMDEEQLISQKEISHNSINKNLTIH